MVDIRKVGLCFVSILVSSCLLYQPVNAHVHIFYRPYHPEILYLGRHIYLEGIGLPSKPEDRASKYIYALVRDNYGKIVDGRLTFTVNGVDSNTTMTLIYPPAANGTWMGEIPSYSTGMPYTVNYRASFKDDLGYSVSESGPYSASDENFTGRQGQGYLVTDRYIYVDGQQLNTPPEKCLWDNTQNAYTIVNSQQGKLTQYLQGDAKDCIKVNFNAIVSVPYNDKIQNVTLHMSEFPKGGGTPYKPQKMIHGNETRGYWSYLAKVAMPIDTTLQYQSTLYDSDKPLTTTNKSLRIMSSSMPTPTIPPNIISVTTYVSNIDIGNQKANMEVKLSGPLINSTDFTMPYSQRKSVIGKAENINLQVVDLSNNNTTPTKREELQLVDLASPPPSKREEKVYIPASFHNLTGTINSVGYGSFDAIIGKDNSSGIGLNPYYARLSGNPLAFPLDHYSVDLFIRIPFVHVQINNNGGTYGDWYKAAWTTDQPQIVGCNSTSNIVKCDPQSRNESISNTYTFVKIYKEFNRNDFAF